MTLKELLNSCDFKDIAPHIAQISNEAAGNLAPFKQAFDILRNLEPAAEGGGELEIVKCYNEFTQNTYPLVKQWFETGPWKYELNSKVIVSDELTLTDAEVAAHCLWELTYLGFDQSTPEGYDKAVKSILGGQDREVTDTSNFYNPYALAAEKLEYMLDINYLPKKFIDEDRYVEKLVNECLDAEPQLFGKIPKNMCRMLKAHVKKLERRAKEEDAISRFLTVNSKSFSREELERKSLKTLERMAKVEDSIRRLTAGTKSFSREELEYLFKTKLIHECPYHSRAYDVHKRTDYFIDLFSNYVSEDFSKYTQFLLMFRTSSDYPLAQSELERLENFFNQYLPASANIRYGYGNDETLGTEVSLLFLGSY